jgi:hypothetical protein
MLLLSGQRLFRQKEATWLRGWPPSLRTVVGNAGNIAHGFNLGKVFRKHHLLHCKEIL